MKEFKLGKIYQGQLKKGNDIAQGLTKFLKDNKIKAGIIKGIGAVESAKLGYFNQQTKEYEERYFNENMEIVSLTGNISLKNDEPFPHLHAVFSKKDFSLVGGHLLSDTLVYAFEFEIVAFEGQPHIREFDQVIGLFIWND